MQQWHSTTRFSLTLKKWKAQQYNRKTKNNYLAMTLQIKTQKEKWKNSVKDNEKTERSLK